MSNRRPQPPCVPSLSLVISPTALLAPPIGCWPGDLDGRCPCTSAACRWNLCGFFSVCLSFANASLPGGPSSHPHNRHEWMTGRTAQSSPRSFSRAQQLGRGVLLYLVAVLTILCHPPAAPCCNNLARVSHSGDHPSKPTNTRTRTRTRTHALRQLLPKPFSRSLL